MKMLSRNPDQIGHMLVKQGIVHLSSIPPGRHKAHHLEKAQVMADSRKAHLHASSNLANAEFTTLQETEDAGPCFVRQGLEEFGDSRAVIQPGDLLLSTNGRAGRV